jgi:hypothetical protein
MVPAPKHLLTRKQFVAMGAASLAALRSRWSDAAPPTSSAGQSRVEALSSTARYSDPPKVELPLSVMWRSPREYTGCVPESRND